MVEFLILAAYGFYYNLKKFLGAFGWLASPFSWFLSWLWGKKREKEGELAGAPNPYLALMYVIAREVVNIVVDLAIPKPKPGDFFGFLKEIARTVIKVSFTLLFLGITLAASSSVGMMVTTVIIGIIDLFIYRIFEYVMPLFLDSIEVPYKGPGDDS